MEPTSLAGQAAIVTGAGRGIGEATALALAAAGADVLVAARTEPEVTATAAAIAEAGRRAEVVVADLSDLDVAAGLADRAVAAFGRLDIVVNNVGGWPPRPFLDTSPRNLAAAFQFNVAVTHAVTRAAVAHLLRSDNASITNISSKAGRAPARGFTAYGTAKAALNHYTRAAAADLAPRIRVNAVAPGAIATSALDVVMTDDDLRRSMEDEIALGRLGRPGDIAAAVVYLASPGGAFVTGKILEVDGGGDTAGIDLGLPDLTAG